MSERINMLVDRLRDHTMSAQEVAEQRISFAFGNAPKEDQSTIEQVRIAITTMMAPKY